MAHVRGLKPGFCVGNARLRDLDELLWSALAAFAATPARRCHVANFLKLRMAKVPIFYASRCGGCSDKSRPNSSTFSEGGSNTLHPQQSPRLRRSRLSTGLKKHRLGASECEQIVLNAREEG